MPYYRVNLIVLCIATFLAAACFQQIVPFLPLFLQDLGVTRNLSQWAGMIYTAHYISAFFFQPFWGRVADRVGRKPMMIRAGICLGCIYLGMSYSGAPWHVILCRFLNGALTGFIPGAIALCATNTPKHLSAKYVAALQTANAAGTIIGPAIGGVLADLLGYRGAIQASGYTVLAATLAVILLVQEKNKVRVEHDSSMWQDTVTSVRHPVLLSVMLTVAFLAFGTTGMQPMLAIYLTELQQGGAKWLSGAVFSLPGVAFVLTASMWTRLGERKGYGQLIPFGLIMAGILGVALSAVHSLLSFSLLYFMQGVFIAILNPAASALIALRVEDNMQGLAFGMLQSASIVGGLVGPMYAGIAGGLGTRWIFAWIGVGLFVGALWLRQSISKWDRPGTSRDNQATAS